MGRDLEIHWLGQNRDEDWAMQGGIIYLYLQICSSQVFNQKVPVLLWKTQKNKVICVPPIMLILRSPTKVNDDEQ